MKVLIITSGPLPLPASKGGAVENLIQKIIDQNEQCKDMELSVISSEDPDLEEKPKYKYTSVFYVKNQKKIYSFKRVIRKGIRKSSKIFFNKIRTIKIYPEFISEAKRLTKLDNYDKIMILSLPEMVLSIRKFYKNEIILYLHNDHLNPTCMNAEKILKECDKVITVSDYIKRQVMKIDKKISNKVITVLNGCDLEKFQPLSLDERTKIREEFRYTSEDIVIVFSGRLHPTKGIFELISAIKKCQNQRVKLLVIGGAFFSSESKSQFEKKLFKVTQGYQNRIQFTGYMSSERIPSMLMSADIAAVPSLFEEPCSLAILEAQAAGLPLITTQVGGTPEITGESSTVLLDTKQDFIEQLTKSIDNLANYPNRRKNMQIESKNWINQFTITNYYNNLVETIKFRTSSE